MDTPDDRLLRQEFLDELQQRAEEFKEKLHRAFIEWYIEAEFGKVEWKFTDDAHDGGIDAVVWRPGETPPVVILQSKFSQKIGGAKLAPAAYHELNRVVEAFRGDDDLFDEFLLKVRGDLRPIYCKARAFLSELPTWTQRKKAFRLVTTCRRRKEEEFHSIPAANFVYHEDISRLYTQYRKGATPRARPLELDVANKLNYSDNSRRVESYLFNARIEDFRQYLQYNDVARLVARNVRYNLGGKIGRSIRKTYEHDPVDFWYYHNGITIVCDFIHFGKGRARLENPSVINGAQTLYAISSSVKSRPSALVTTRVIVRGTKHYTPHEDDEWLQDVIRGVNTQNRVLAADFWSNEPEQFELQQRFREFGVFYERKRAEWKEYKNDPRFKDFDTFSLTRLGQVLAAIESDADGDGVLLVKRGLEDVFSDRNYRRLFPSKKGVQFHFKRIYLGYRLYRFIDRFGYKDAKQSRKQSHAFWNSFWLLYKGITGSAKLPAGSSAESIRDAFDVMESGSTCGIRARRLLRSVINEVWRSWREEKKVDPEHWTANNFFKSKFGNQRSRIRLMKKFKKELGGWRKEFI